MPLLGRWRKATPGSPRPPTPPPLRVLRADGQRVDLTARDAGTRIALIRQDWQGDAWAYRDMIGELRYAHRLLARSVARVRFFAAEARAYPENPIDLAGDGHGLDPRLASEAVESLARLPLDDGPDGFVATLIENIATAGEAWIHGQPDDGDGEQWRIRSISEIIGVGDQVMLTELPTSTTMGQRPIDPHKEELLRCWVRHPRWGQLADSPLRAMLDVLEEIVLTGREIRAAARSRIASNGILIIPNSLTLLRTREDEEGLLEQGVLDADFMRDFTEALTAPIRNEGDAGAVVPLVLRGDTEALKEVRHLTLARDDAIKLMERLQGAVLRMLQGLDIQPEQVQGLGPVNHWTGWQVEASSVRHQVLPMAGIGAACLNKAFLLPSLRALGHSPESLRRVIIGYDATGLVESPNRAVDAREAWDRDTISNETLRSAHGFGDEDAPDTHEHLVRLLTRGRLTPEAVPLVAALSGVSLDDPALTQALAIAVGLGARATAVPRPVSAPGAPGGGAVQVPQPLEGVPGQAVPALPTAQGPPVVVAGVGRQVELARALAGVDAGLEERLHTAADAAVCRAVERADARVRNTFRRDRAVTASIEGVAAAAAALGRGPVMAAVPVADLLAGSCARLIPQAEGWLVEAGETAAGVVVQLLGVGPEAAAGTAVRDALAGHRAGALVALVAAVEAAAERALFQDGPGQVTRGDIRGVLALAGGGGAGLGTGSVVQDALAAQWAVIRDEMATQDRIRGYCTGSGTG